MKTKHYKYEVAEVTFGSGSFGQKFTSRSEALRLANHILREGRSCVIRVINKRE